jgi:hypothetical protein
VKIVENHTKMNLKIKTIAILLLTVNLTFARIGATYQDCVKRYGEPTASVAGDPENSTHMFKKSGFLITITISKNKSYIVSYVKLDKDLKFTKTELTNILSANGDKWSKTENIDGKEKFETENKKLIALYIDGKIDIYDLIEDVPKLDEKSTEGL